jgi:RNA polymerase sigma factor (sigma-70 family)
VAIRTAVVAPNAYEGVPSELDGGYSATFSRLRATFRARGLSAEDAADLAQEAATRTLVHLRRHGQRRADLAPLINTIARNLLVEEFRAPRNCLPTEIDPNDVVDTLDVAEEVGARELAGRLRDAIQALPERHRCAVLMCLSGSSPAEIALELGIKRNAADAILHRARRRLAVQLSDLRGALAGILVSVRTRTSGMGREALGRIALTGQDAVALSQLIAAIALFGTILTGPRTVGEASHTPPSTHDRVSVITIPRIADPSVEPAAAAVDARPVTTHARKKALPGEREYRASVCTKDENGEPAQTFVEAVIRDDGKPSPVYETVTRFVPLPGSFAPEVPVGGSCE